MRGVGDEGSGGRCGSSLCIGYLEGGRTGGGEGEGCVFVVIYLLICLCICILVSFCK